MVEIKAEHLLLALIGTYVIVVPTLSFIPLLDPFSEKRILQVGVLIAVSGGLLGVRAARQRWLETFIGLPCTAQWGLGVVLCLSLLSSVLAPASFYAFLEVGHFILLFVTAGLVASEVRRTPEWTQRALLGVVAVSGGLYAIYFAVGYGAHLAIADIEPWPNGATNYANIRFFNHYQTWTIPLLAGAVLAVPRRWRAVRGGVFGLLSLWWTLVLASNVRGTVVALVLATIGVFLIFHGRAKRWLAVQGAAVLAGVLLYYIFFPSGTPPQVVDELANTGTDSRRLQLWRTCLEMTGAHPWLGAGPMHFAWPPYHYAKGASPHSALMQWFAEWGIPSTLVMSGLTIWGGWRWIQQERDRLFSRSAPEPVAVALVAALTAGAAHSMVSGLILAPLSQVFLACLGGWAWGRYQHDGVDLSFSFNRFSHVALSVVLLGSTLVVGSSVKDLFQAQERRKAFLESVDRNVLSPRYWTQGYIEVRDSSVIEQARRDR